MNVQVGPPVAKLVSQLKRGLDRQRCQLITGGPEDAEHGHMHAESELARLQMPDMNLPRAENRSFNPVKVLPAWACTSSSRLPITLRGFEARDDCTQAEVKRNGWWVVHRDAHKASHAQSRPEHESARSLSGAR